MRIKLQINAPVVTLHGDTIASGVCVHASHVTLRENSLEIMTSIHRDAATCDADKHPIYVADIGYIQVTLTDAEITTTSQTLKSLVANKMKTKLDAIYGAANVVIL